MQTSWPRERQFPGSRWPTAVMVLGGLVSVPSRAWALDPFEVQVYTPDVDPTGHVGLELHSIYYATGESQYDGSALPLHHQLHETLEPSVGLGRGLELGGYFQTAVVPGEGYAYAGVKLRLKWRLPLGPHAPVQLALNGELSYLPSRFDSAVWGSELRPILEWRPGHWVLDVNPIVTVAWTGPYAGVPALEPCASVRYEIAHVLAPGLEYYAAFGPVTAIDPLSTQGHYIVETLDVLAVDPWELHVGVGEGLTSTSRGVLFDAIVGYAF